jgi:triphosphoribosyl-dephospho-CoA synthetase
MMQTQQDLERQINEVLTKISVLQLANEKRVEQQDSAVNAQPAVVQQSDTDSAKYQKKLEELEAQLTNVTRQRLDYLERLQQQHLEIQVSLGTLLLDILFNFSC